MLGAGCDRRYARSVLAEGQHASESPRRTPLIVVGGVAVVAIVVALIFAFTGGSDGPLGVVGGDTPETPEFAFKVSKPIVITTRLIPNPEAPQPTPSQVQAAKKKATAAALPAAKVAVDTLDTYYTAAFLDPANWQDAAYDEVFVAFSNQARAEAESQLEIMTAGSEAGSDYDTIVPLPSTVRTKVLLDPKGLPASVIGMANFEANGNGSGGKHTIQSKGEFVLQKVDGEWTIVSFSVSRSDKEKNTSPSGQPSGSADPSASESPS